MLWRHFQRMKENDGRAARNATIRVGKWFVAAQTVLVVIYLLVRVEEGPPQIQPIHISGFDPGDVVVFANSHQERRTAVLEAKYFLIDIHVPPTAVSSHNGHNSYHGVQGVFCPLDWHLQKQNPSAVPMFRDLISSSRHCQQHRIELDLLEIVQQVRHYDTVHATTTHSHHHHQQHHHSPLSTTTTTIAPKQLHLAGIVFHETRCGSTLTANLLSAADPIAHRVYSEASPLLTALLTTCTTTTSSKDCDETKANALLQDVLYLMGRSNDVRETRVFYKIQSVGVRSMSPLVEQQLLPNGVPWIFLYRNSVEVMMSHFKNAPSIRKNNKATKAVCLRGREQPHPLITDIAKTHNRTLQSLSNAEYCAIHLASLCEAAIRQHDNDNQVGGGGGGGRFVNYDTLPDILWETILPNHVGVVSPHISGMKQAAAVYSKGRGMNANKVWEEDSSRKQSKASEDIRQAAFEFLEPFYERLQELSTASRE